MQVRTDLRQALSFERNQQAVERRIRNHIVGAEVCRREPVPDTDFLEGRDERDVLNRDRTAPLPLIVGLRVDGDDQLHGIRRV
jgi:hypothetical protein